MGLGPEETQVFRLLVCYMIFPYGRGLWELTPALWAALSALCNFLYCSSGHISTRGGGREVCACPGQAKGDLSFNHLFFIHSFSRST